MPTTTTMPRIRTSTTSASTASAPPGRPQDPAAILREAPENDTAIRWLLSWYMEMNADLDATIAALQAEIVALQHPTQPLRRPSLRPAIVALLRERGAPMTSASITQALDAPRSLADTCRDMATAGLLVRDNGHYTLPPDPAQVATNGLAPKRRGRIKAPAG